MASYQVTDGSSLTVKARSSIHDTSTLFHRVAGTVEANPDELEQNGATARFTVDMSAFDAGDWLKNRKLKKDLQLDRYPSAEFELRGLRDVKRTGDQFEAVADGVIRYRGREVTMAIAGRGTMTGDRIEASGSFDIDIRTLGLTPPKVLVFKVEPEVTIAIELRAVAS